MVKIDPGQIQDLNLEADHDPGLKAGQDLEQKADQGRAQIDQNQDLDLGASHDQFQDQGLRVNRLKDLNQCHAQDQTVQATEVQVVQDHVQDLLVVQEAQGPDRVQVHLAADQAGHGLPARHNLDPDQTKAADRILFNLQFCTIILFENKSFDCSN